MRYEIGSRLVREAGGVSLSLPRRLAGWSRSILCVGFGLGLVFGGLAGCGSGDQQSTEATTFDGRPAEAAGLESVPAANDLNLDLVSPDAFAALVVMPQQLLGQEWAQASFIGERVDEITGEFGVDPRRMKRVLLVMSPPQETGELVLVGRIELDEPIDLGAVVERLSQSIAKAANELPGGEASGPVRFQQVESGGKTFYESLDKGLGLHQAEDGSIWFGDASRLRALAQSTGASGALARRLRGTELQGQAMMLVDFQPIRPLVLDAIDSGAGGQAAESGGEASSSRKMAERLDLIRVTWDSAAESPLEARADVGDAELAEELSKGARKQMGILRFAVPTMLSQMLREVPEDVNSSLTTLMYGVLRGVDISVEGTEVCAKVTAPEGAGESIGVLLEYAAEARAKVERRGRVAKVAGALVRYREEHETFPVSGAEEWFDDEGRPKLSWRVHLLPELGYESLYGEFHLDESWDSPHNAALLERMPEEYQGGDESNETSVLAFTGPGTAMQLDNPKSAEGISDDPDMTLLMMDAGDSRRVPWTQPSDLESLTVEELANLIPESQGFAGVFTVDGKPRKLKLSVTAEEWAGLLSAAGGEELPETLFVLERPPLAVPGGGFPGFGGSGFGGPGQ